MKAPGVSPLTLLVILAVPGGLALWALWHVLSRVGAQLVDRVAPPITEEEARQMVDRAAGGLL